MISISQYEEDNLIIITETGKVSYEEKVEMINKNLAYLKQKERINILHDMRYAVYDHTELKDDSIKQLSALFSEGNQIIKHAAVHHSEIGTAISILFENSGLPQNFKHKVFYTKEAALQWLSED